MLMMCIDGGFVFVIPFSLGNTGDLFPKEIKKRGHFWLFDFFLFQPVDKTSLGAGALKV